MATPVGHYLVGLAITQGLANSGRDRKQGIVLAAVAVLPDFDLVAGLFVGNVWAYHRVVSHSLIAAFSFGLVALSALALFQVRRPIHAATMLLLVYLSHLVLDYATVDARYPDSGVPFLWPWLESRFQSPLTLVHAGRFSFSELISLFNVSVVIRETLIFLPLAALAATLRHADASWLRAIPWHKNMAWVFAGWFAVAVLASLAIGLF